MTQKVDLCKSRGCVDFAMVANLNTSGYSKKKLYGPFLRMRFNCLKATERLPGDSQLFTTRSSGDPGTHLIDLGKIKG